MGHRAAMHRSTRRAIPHRTVVVSQTQHSYKGYLSLCAPTWRSREIFFSDCTTFLYDRTSSDLSFRGFWGFGVTLCSDRVYMYASSSETGPCIFLIRDLHIGEPQLSICVSAHPPVFFPVEIKGSVASGPADWERFDISYLFLVNCIY